MRGSTGGSPIAVFPLAQLTPTNGLTIFSNVSSENALTDFTVRGSVCCRELYYRHVRV